MRCLPFAIALLGCGSSTSAGSDSADGDPISTTTTAAPSTSSTTTTSSGSPGETTMPADDTASVEVTTSDEGVGVIQAPDGGDPNAHCDLWAQDCPPGEKCMPWDDSGGNSWSASRCTPLDRNPKGTGESCTVVDSGVSGIDDCAHGAMCWNVDPATNMGTCVAMCVGSEANPLCTDPCARCNINADGTLLLCLAGCDPLAQNCEQASACYPINDAFVCAPDAGGEAGGVGEPCEFVNVCDPGLFCADPRSVPDCVAEIGCCAPFCNADRADVCDALLPGTSCVPWYAEGQTSDACGITATIGACALR